MPTLTTTEFTFADLLERAVTEPGLISTAYTAFHNYSLGNQILALVQCAQRGLTPGPIATFMGWKAKGRFVRKGEKAIALCMPITYRRPATADDEDDATFTRFVYRPHWFVLSQTDGTDVPALDLPEWEATRALQTLTITEVPFTLMNGNAEGYASARTIAVSPVSPDPHAARFHELAHVVLGHTSDKDATPKAMREVEAEAVALLCLEALGLPGAACCRGYIQGWNRNGGLIPERHAQRIFKAADAILRAGRAISRDDAVEAA